MKKSILVLILFTCLSCKHADKAEFAMKVINDPENIEKYILEAPFSSKMYYNYFIQRKEYCINELKKAKEMCSGNCDIVYSKVLPLHKDRYLIIINNNKNFEITFNWHLINDQWDFSSINVEVYDSLNLQNINK